MHSLMLQWPKIHRAIVLRGIAAGTAWGVTVSAALLGLVFYQCGTICLGQIVETSTLSVMAGVVAIGPLAAFQRNAQTPAQ